MINTESLRNHLCLVCGSTHADEEDQGIWQRINNPCNNNKYTYTVLTGSKFYSMIFNMLGGGEIFAGKDDLISSAYFKPMPGYDQASDLERRFYLYQREMDWRLRERLKAYIEREEDFYGKIGMML